MSGENPQPQNNGQQGKQNNGGNNQQQQQGGRNAPRRRAFATQGTYSWWLLFLVQTLLTYGTLAVTWKPAEGFWRDNYMLIAPTVALGLQFLLTSIPLFIGEYGEFRHWSNIGNVLDIATNIIGGFWLLDITGLNPPFVDRTMSYFNTFTVSDVGSLTLLVLFSILISDITKALAATPKWEGKQR